MSTVFPSDYAYLHVCKHFYYISEICIYLWTSKAHTCTVEHNVRHKTHTTICADWCKSSSGLGFAATLSHEES